MPKKLKYINAALIILSALILITNVTRSMNFGHSPIPRMLSGIIVLTFIVKYLLKHEKPGYILCLILGYSVMVYKLLVISTALRLAEGAGIRILLAIDALLMIVFIILGHMGLSSAKKLAKEPQS